MVVYIMLYGYVMKMGGMKLEYLDGCTTSLTIDDIESIDVSDEVFTGVLHKLIDREKDIAVLQQIYMNLMVSQGEEKDLGYCEQCGSYNSLYTLEI